MRYQIDLLLRETQFGFHQGRGCKNAIFALKQQWKYHWVRQRIRCRIYRSGKKLLIVCTKRTFGWCWYNTLWMNNYWISLELSTRTVNDYDDDKVSMFWQSQQPHKRPVHPKKKYWSAVRTSVDTADLLPVSQGVRHGCVIATLVHHLYGQHHHKCQSGVRWPQWVSLRWRSKFILQLQRESPTPQLSKPSVPRIRH